MAKLNQIVALVNGVKGRVQKQMNEVYHKLQKGDLFSGLERNYQHKIDGESETLPSEKKRVQYTAKQAVEDARKAMAELLNVVATQDVNNCGAIADLVVGDRVVANNVPVTHLLFLEKQLVDLNTFVGKIPTLSLDEEWHEDEHNPGLFRGHPYTTLRQKKVRKNHEIAPATEHHPAQVEVFTEDVTIGEWNNVKFSGAIPANQKLAMLERVRNLQDAVKVAREEANQVEVTPQHTGDKLLKYVFDGV